MVGGSLAKKLTRRFRARVTVDGDTWARDDFMAVAASCVEQIGLGFKPFYRCNERVHSFALLGIHAASPLGFAFELPRIWRGRPMRRDKTIDAVASEVRFEHDEISYVVDGDTYTVKESLRVANGPKLTFLRLSGQVGG